MASGCSRRRRSTGSSKCKATGSTSCWAYRLKIGVGYGLPWPEVLPFVPEGRVCFGTGAGGSLVIADADRRMTVAYVMNKMVPCLIVAPIAAALVERVYDIVNR